MIITLAKPEWDDFWGLGSLVKPGGVCRPAGLRVAPAAEKDPMSFAILYYLVRFRLFQPAVPGGHPHGGASDVYALRWILPWRW